MKTMKPQNRTGGKIAPLELQKTVEGAEQYSPLNVGDATSLNFIRSQYVKDKSVIGTLAPPASLKQGASMFLELLKGQDISVLVDRLSERLAFEMSGTRLYDALIFKFESSPEEIPGLTLEDLQQIREDEHAHFLLLSNTIEELGGDPTVISPAADASATATSGLCKVVTDPRTTLVQALDAMLIAELADNDGWTLLIDICDELGLKELSERFLKALQEEDEHLENVRSWLLTASVKNAKPATKARALRTLGPRSVSEIESGSKKGQSRNDSSQKGQKGARKGVSSGTQTSAKSKTKDGARTSAKAKAKTGAKAKTKAEKTTKAGAGSKTRSTSSSSSARRKSAKDMSKTPSGRSKSKAASAKKGKGTSSGASSRGASRRSKPSGSKRK